MSYCLAAGKSEPSMNLSDIKRLQVVHLDDSFQELYQKRDMLYLAPYNPHKEPNGIPLKVIESQGEQEQVYFANLKAATLYSHRDSSDKRIAILSYGVQSVLKVGREVPVLQDFGSRQNR